MKKYIAHYAITITLFFASIVSTMDRPLETPSLADIRKALQSLYHNAETASAREDSSKPTDLYVFSSESTYRMTPQRFEYRHDEVTIIKNLAHFNLITHDPIICTQAKNHNKSIPLIAADNDALRSICNQLTNSNHSFVKTINNILALSATCTHFNNKLEDFGKMLQCYDSEIKNDILEKILQKINDFTYWSKRRSILLLVHAGAEHNTCYHHYPLLLRATRRNDLDMINILFRYGADANLKSSGEPIFFNSRSPEMVELFQNNGADLNIVIDSSLVESNVLFNCLVQDRPQLIPFYIDKKVNPRVLDCEKRSLLHYIAVLNIKSYKNSLPMAKILLDTIGDMINTLDHERKTPLDLLLKEKYFPKKNIIALFKEYGAKTSQELKQSQL